MEDKIVRSLSEMRSCVRTRARRGAVGRTAGWALLVGGAVAGCVASPHGMPPGNADPTASEWKLSPGLALQSGELESGGISVLIRTAGPVSERQRRELCTAGLAVDTMAGDIITGRVARGSLQTLAALPFVRYVERSQPLRLQLERRP